MDWDRFLAEQIGGVKAKGSNTRLDMFIKNVVVATGAVALGVVDEPKRLAGIVNGAAANLGASERSEVVEFLNFVKRIATPTVDLELAHRTGDADGMIQERTEGARGLPRGGDAYDYTRAP